MTRIIAQIDAAAIKGASQSADHMIIRTNIGPVAAVRFALGFNGPEEFGRRVDNGPILSGPYLYGFGISTAIHNGPLTASAPELHIKHGDVIRIRNLVERGHLRTFDFRVTIKRGYPEFECISGQESKMTTTAPLNIEPTEISKEEYKAKLKAEYADMYNSKK